MTSEELNRTIEFIVASQARLATAQEQERRDRVEFQDWSKTIFLQMSELFIQQSRRMDRLDKFYADWLSQNRDFQEQAMRFQSQALHLLHLILDRLPTGPGDIN
jgi:hypothetical protein